jgi:hypothetical protein
MERGSFKEGVQGHGRILSLFGSISGSSVVRILGNKLVTFWFRYRLSLFTLTTCLFGDELSYIVPYLSSLRSIPISIPLLVNNTKWVHLAYYANSQLLSRSTKLKLYRMLIRPVSYLCHWNLDIEHFWWKCSLNIWIIRKIYGPVCEDGVWRVRSNSEIHSLLQGEDTVRHAKSLRLCKVQYNLITWSICNVITLLYVTPVASGN